MSETTTVVDDVQAEHEVETDVEKDVEDVEKEPSKPDSEGISKSDFDEVKRQLAELMKNKSQQEHTITSLKKANADLKREAAAKMTDAELAAEREAEAEAKVKEAKLFMSKAKAKEIFAGAGFVDTDYADVLEAIVTEDEDQTVVAATNIVTMYEGLKKRIEKSLRENIMKETPPPPVGAGNAPFDKDIDKKIRAAMGGLR